MRSAFHLAYHVTDLDTSRRFYGDVLGCREGRSTDTWVDFDFSDIRFPCISARRSPLPEPAR